MTRMPAATPGLWRSENEGVTNINDANRFMFMKRRYSSGFGLDEF
jgi:hypothetical protein